MWKENLQAAAQKHFWELLSGELALVANRVQKALFAIKASQTRRSEGEGILGK